MIRRLLAAALAAVTLARSIAAATPVEASGYDPFPIGECTWYAALIRPDLVGAVWGNARQWPEEAAWSGKPTGTIPAVGAVAVLQPGIQGADGYGHVAIVERVAAGGWFEVSQRNWWPAPWRVTYSWFRAGHGISFIYR